MDDEGPLGPQPTGVPIHGYNPPQEAEAPECFSRLSNRINAHTKTCYVCVGNCGLQLKHSATSITRPDNGHEQRYL